MTAGLWLGLVVQLIVIALGAVLGIALGKWWRP